MNTIVLSNILARLAPSNSGFAIYGAVNNETEFQNGVVFNTPSERPTWSQVKEAEPDEEWVVVRATRDGLLDRSDWVVLSDVPLTTEKKQQW